MSRKRRRWLDWFTHAAAPKRTERRPIRLESLEDRLLLHGGVHVTSMQNEQPAMVGSSVAGQTLGQGQTQTQGQGQDQHRLQCAGMMGAQGGQTQGGSQQQLGAQPPGGSQQLSGTQQQGIPQQGMPQPGAGQPQGNSQTGGHSCTHQGEQSTSSTSTESITGETDDSETSSNTQLTESSGLTVEAADAYFYQLGAQAGGNANSIGLSPTTSTNRLAMTRT